MKDEKERTSENIVKDKEVKDLKKRTKEYALRVLRLYERLPKYGAVHLVTHQLARSGTSPGAQYREACRAKSDADFVSKMEGALQELEESGYWLELLLEGNFVKEDTLKPLRNETDELIAIFASIVIKTKNRINHKIK